MLRKIIVVGGIAVVVLAVILLGRTVLLRSVQVEATASSWRPAAPDSAASRLAAAVRLPTVAGADSAFAALHAHLRASFPRVHAALEVATLNEHSLLYTWRGSDASLEPMLCAAHLDVVPVEPGTEGDWEHPPFAGAIADGYIWGRGTMDDKLSVLGLLEAAEALLAEGFAPRRTIYLAFGHDEEVGGRAGAAAIASRLAGEGVRLESVLDEGLMLTSGLIPGIAEDVALIGIAEKGYLTVELSTRDAGGHSSVPPRSTAVGRLARALTRLEEQPLAGGIDGPAGQMFATLAPHLPFGQRLAFANLWCLGWLVEGQLASKPTTDALLRTTTAATVFSGGIKANVLPQHARALVNFRIHPRDSVASVLAHIEAVVADTGVAVSPVEGGFSGEPSAVSPTDGAPFQRLARTVREVFPEALVAPSLMIAATDTRHYSGLSGSIFRFSPQRLTPADRTRFHGTNERLEVEGYAAAIAFYRQWLRNGAE